MYLNAKQKRESLKRFKQRITECQQAKEAYYGAPLDAPSEVLKPLRENYENAMHALSTYALMCREDGVL